MFVPIIIGSDKDLSHAEKIKKKINEFGVNSTVRICSAHKCLNNLVKMLVNYENDKNVVCVITCAGKSNALSGVVDSNLSKPVIACPPLKNETMYDLYSSTSMPGDVVPMVVLNPSNAGLAAIKICGLFDINIQNKLLTLHESNSNKLIIDDLSYKYGDHNLRYDLLKNYEYKEDDTNYFKCGKIRNIYKKDENLVMVATDRLSSFDRVLTTIPYKGVILNKVSEWWFNRIQNIIPHHMISSKDRQMEVENVKVFQIEFVMRSYLTGSTSTSIWKNYEKGLRNYCGHNLPDGMIRNQKLEKVLLTPTTKGITDELISKNTIINNEIMTAEEWEVCENYAHELFDLGTDLMNDKGLILVDTKYEFGKTKDGHIILVDEVHTPDSSRFWVKHSYEERMRNNQEPEMIDKEFIRKWIKKTYSDPYNEPNIEITDEMRLKTLNKYLQLYEIITGEELGI